MRFRNMGVKTKQELLFKTSIIFDYYDRHKDVLISGQTDEEKLNNLRIKKDQLEKEIERLNRELDIILDEIKKIKQKGAIIK